MRAEGVINKEEISLIGLVTQVVELKKDIVHLIENTDKIYELLGKHEEGAGKLEERLRKLEGGHAKIIAFAGGVGAAISYLIDHIHSLLK
jgi:rRNA processing protein Krr1/Pno1